MKLITHASQLVPGQEPPGTTMLHRRKAWAILRLVREYVIDFNLENAAMRCEMEYAEAKKLEREALFQSSLQEHIETLSAEDVISRQEILMALKREAFNTGPSGSAATRIAALKELARLLNMEPEQKNAAGGTPIININLTPAPAAPVPVVKVS